MKISINWLKNYINTTLSTREISRLLTAGGLEVENVEKFETIPGGLKGLIIGQIKTCVKHPNADKLSLTTVDVGAIELLQIVCGAPNVAAGQKVIVATVGTFVHPVNGESFEIKKSKIRGEFSEGMICSEDEVGLGNSHDGILVLPADSMIGSAVSEFFKVEEDEILEIGLTPNRADAASHFGIARDLSAIINTKVYLKELNQKAIFKKPELTQTSPSSSSNIKVTVDDATACPRYSGITLTKVKVRESPEWLKNRLKSIGINPINNIVDITNFVLHETGQPLHAFDADEIKNEHIVVRKAKAGEKFVTLDGIERTLTADDLMICDEENALCIAGVFGGMKSGIKETTKNIFIESAYFNPSTIRKTSKHHGLKTDASFRFERGTDPDITVYAMMRAANLINEIAGGEISKELIDIYPQKLKPVQVKMEYSFINNFSGHEIKNDVVKLIMEESGMKIISDNSNDFTIEVPLYKVDVLRPVDVVEEILRIYGYDRIPVPAKLNSSLPSVPDFDPGKLKNRISNYLSSNGFYEILNNSLTQNKYADEIIWKEENAVKILNPLSQELGIMRESLLYSGLESIQYNRNRRNSDLKIFEFGKTYRKINGKYSEENHLSLFITGKKYNESWTGDKSNSDFYFLKSYVENILSVCGIELNFSVKENNNEFSSSLSGKIDIDVLSDFGTLKNSIVKKFDLTTEVFYADIRWDNIIKHARKKTVQYSEVSKFPSVKRDLSMLIDKAITYSQIENIALKVEPKLLKNVNLFDVYEGEKIENGKKSYAVSFILQDENQTLNETQIDKVMDRLMKALEKEVNAVIRKS